jgi:hypothetical protein
VKVLVKDTLAYTYHTLYKKICSTQTHTSAKAFPLCTPISPVCAAMWAKITIAKMGKKEGSGR